MAEDDHGLSEIEDIATTLDEIKQMAKMMKTIFQILLLQKKCEKPTPLGVGWIAQNKK